MAGDVNLYFNDMDDPHMAEIEVMVAERESRRRGIAMEALHIMMWYGVEELNIKTYVAKINDTNMASQQLFAKLGYVKTSHSDVFQETTMTLEVTSDVRQTLSQQCSYVARMPYDNTP
mmetsp:Transcript_32209/g.52049  ORF Transcript_32209/g.52049 Transcript_32209/m.52049 type:complete len:118 (-) Transcript_32209:487-840(-)